MIKVSVVIPNWNGEKLLAACLTSLSKQTFTDFEVIVVDNGSDDKSCELIKDKFPSVQLISLDKNYGFAKAVNIGIKASKGEFIVLLNNDTKVERNCLIELIKCAKNNRVDMVAAKMLNFYQPNLIDSVGDFIDVVGHANNIGLGERDGNVFNQEKKVFLITGGGCLIKKKVFDKVGFFDEDYFAYFEDVDFCLRAQLMGYKAVFCPRARIYHIHKATSSKNPGFTEYLQFRNMTMTIIKNFPNRLLFKDLNWLRILLVNLNTIRYLASIGYLTPAIKAEWFIIKNIRRLLEKREFIQSNKLVADEYFIENIYPKKITFFGLLKGGV